MNHELKRKFYHSCLRELYHNTEYGDFSITLDFI